MTTFSTPAGIPASSSGRKVAGRVEGCLLRQLQHHSVAVRRARSHLPGGIAAGKFHGVINPTSRAGAGAGM